MRWPTFFIFGALVLLVPSVAWAWGPFTHLLCARTLLESTVMLPAPIASLLTAFASDFYYGNVAADIVIAKNLASHMRHAHNWQNALRLLRSSDEPGQRAFSLGYLTHLAADTIAHNYFIPLKLVQSFPTKFLKHTYWEARFDKGAYDSVADLASELTTSRFPDNDHLHESHIAGTLFPFRVNKRIFDNVFLLQNLARWQRTVVNADERSGWPLTDEEWREYLTLSVSRMRALLWKLEDSSVIEVDPRGEEALAAAKQIRRELKRLLRRGALRSDHTGAVAEHFRPLFRAAADGLMETPDIVPLLAKLRELDDAALRAGVALPATRRPVLQRVVEVAAEADGRRGARRRKAEPPRNFPHEPRLDGDDDA